VRSKPGLHGAKALLIDNTGKHLEDAFDVDQRRVVGEGGYATVFIGKDKRTGVDRAIKCITKKMVANRQRLQREIDIVMALDHPNINRLFQTFEDRKYIYLILELCSGGELFDRIQELGHLSEREAAIIMQQIFRAVYYMHERGVCHRDLKPENFLFQHKAPIEGNTLKVIDFGIAATFEPAKGGSFSTRTGTPYYVAPEVLQYPFTQYGPECDMWSAGVIMYVLLSGRLPFRGVDDNATFAKVKAAKVNFPADVFANVSEAAKTLIRRLLTKDPAQRYSAEVAVSDAWARNHAPSAAPAPLHKSVVEALRTFQAENKLKKVALHVVARQLDESQIKQLRNIFMELDANGDGHLTLAELGEGLRRSELGSVPEDLSELLQNLDVDGSGQIDYTEFLAATLERRQYNSENICWAAFRVFDKNNDGKISHQELVEVLASQDVVQAIGRDQVTELMKEFDRDGDGNIDFEEFMAMMMR